MEKKYSHYNSNIRCSGSHRSHFRFSIKPKKIRRWTKIQSTSNVEIVNSYTNTEQLIKDFPVINNTTVLDGIEKNIQNRLLTGFANWNRGFEARKAWGNILYTKDSIYNVHGARLTLEHYQEDMYETLGKMSIGMGNFNNMLIVGNYCAIYYDIIIW